jgi:hypothetical protein
MTKCSESGLNIISRLVFKLNITVQIQMGSKQKKTRRYLLIKQILTQILLQEMTRPILQSV